MSEKVEIFDQLRDKMRIAQPSLKKGLNDDGDEQISIQTSITKVRRFRQSKNLQKRAKTDVAYQKNLKQIDKYWEKLFTVPIQVQTTF